VDHFSQDLKTAFEAKCEAQRIAFAPMTFQACRLLRKYGLLEQVHRSGAAGLTLSEIVSAATLPRYAVKVLMESGLGIGVFRRTRPFPPQQLGYFILRSDDAAADVVHDVLSWLFRLDGRSSKVTRRD
jgi:hypothetical protein